MGFIKEILTLEPITTIDLIHLVELYFVYSLVGTFFALPGEALIRLLRIEKRIALRIKLRTHCIIIPLVTPPNSKVNGKKINNSKEINKIKKIKETFIDVTKEEVFFRALPLIVFGPNGAIVAHVIWAGLHAFPDCLYVGTSSILELRLWLGGLWIQGFLVHLCHNLFEYLKEWIGDYLEERLSDYLRQQKGGEENE